MDKIDRLNSINKSYINTFKAELITQLVVLAMSHSITIEWLQIEDDLGFRISSINPCNIYMEWEYIINNYSHMLRDIWGTNVQVLINRYGDIEVKR